MDTYIVAQDQVAMILQEAECGDPVRLVRDRLEEHGLKPWAHPKIDLFARAGRCLLLAYPSPPRRTRIAPNGPRIRRRS